MAAALHGNFEWSQAWCCGLPFASLFDADIQTLFYEERRDQAAKESSGEEAAVAAVQMPDIMQLEVSRGCLERTRLCRSFDVEIVEWGPGISSPLHLHLVSNRHLLTLR